MDDHRCQRTQIGEMVELQRASQLQFQLFQQQFFTGSLGLPQTDTFASAASFAAQDAGSNRNARGPCLKLQDRGVQNLQLGNSVLAQLKDEHSAQLAKVEELSTSRQGLKGNYQQPMGRLIPPFSSADMENNSREDSIAISEIMVLKEELNILKNKLKFAQDNQTEQEIALLQMKEEQRHEKQKAQVEQHMLRTQLEKELLEKEDQLARRERRMERKRAERAERAAQYEPGHGIQRWIID